MNNKNETTANHSASRVNWNPAIILALVATTVLFAGLFVSEKAGHVEASTEVADEAGATHQEFNWRLAMSWPKNFPGLGTGPEDFADMVEEMSDGRLKIHVYGAGELVPALGVFDAVSTGSVEMGHSGAYYYRGKIPAAGFFAAVPFGMNVMEQNAWIYYGGGLELWHELYEPLNLIAFPGGNTGMQMGGWFNREINSVEDFKGLKMRIPGMAGEVFSRAGGSAVAIPGGELYTAMQTGVIDALEWVGPYNDRAFGFPEVGQYYYTPGWHESSAMLEFEINLDAWNSLPEDLQKIIEVATRAVNGNMLAEYTYYNAISMQELLEQGVEVRKFPDDLLAELKRHAFEFYEEEAARDEGFARVSKSYFDFMDTVEPWMVQSEKALYEYREALE